MTRLTTRPATRPSLAALCAAVLALAGCVGLPNSGPVQVGLERAPEPEGIVFLAQDPRPGDNPEQIVAGFLDAATAGVADRFETAQKYLTESARSAWKPGAGVTIYAGSTPPTLLELSTDRVRVSVNVSAHVNSGGVYTEEPPERRADFGFTLSRVEGQWRIDALADGVLMSGVNFGSQYRQVTLAYFSQDLRYIVPDPRWFPEQNSASFAVNALVEGPVPWLEPGVANGIPAGTLAEPVSVTDGIAEVNLSDAALAASPVERSMLAIQIEDTLVQVPQVRRVNIFVDGIPLEADPFTPAPIVDLSIGHAPYALHDGLLCMVVGSTAIPVKGGLPFETAEVTDIALPYVPLEPDLTAPVVARIGQERIETIPWEGAEDPVVVAEVTGGILAPSYDRFGWVWTGATHNAGSLIVTRAGTEIITLIPAVDLEDMTVRSIRVSRDGVRIAISAETGGEVKLLMGIIQRDINGDPLEVSQTVQFGRSLTESTEIVWVDSATLGVLGVTDGGAPTVHTVPIAGPAAALLSVQDATSLASGRGEREMWIVTTDHQLYLRAGNGWRRAGDDLNVSAPAFPG